MKPDLISLRFIFTECYPVTCLQGVNIFFNRRKSHTFFNNKIEIKFSNKQ